MSSVRSGTRNSAPESPHDSSPYGDGYAVGVAVEDVAESRRIMVVMKEGLNWGFMAGSGWEIKELKL